MKMNVCQKYILNTNIYKYIYVLKDTAYINYKSVKVSA